jgi:hypothetical protein
MVASQSTRKKMANLTQLLCQTPMMNPVRLSINDNHLKSLDNLSTLSHFLPLVEQEAVLGIIFIGYANVPKGNIRGPIGTFSLPSALALWDHLL